MKEKFSLVQIIKMVLDDKGVEYENSSNDSNIVFLRRAFYRLIERLGSDKELLKNGEKTIEFEESEVPFMKVILSQLYGNRGLIADLSNELNGNKAFSEKKIRELIQAVIDEADKSGMDETEFIQMALFLVRIFRYSPLRSIETCHKVIDTFSNIICDLPINQQIIYLLKVERFLKKECSLRYAEFIINTQVIADCIERGLDIGVEYYCADDSEIMEEDIRRDKEVLEAIQQDDDLRQYIEKKFGKRAEEIFGHTE